MLRRIVIFILTVGLLVSSLSAARIAIDDQVVCEIEPGTDPYLFAEMLGGKIVDRVEGTNIYLFSYNRAIYQDTVMNYLHLNVDVEYAQPNYMITILDLEQTSQPFVDETSQAFVDGTSPVEYFEQLAESQMFVDDAHIITTGDNIVVAVLDGGLDIRHPLFAGRIHPASYDCIDGDDEPWVTFGDAGDHGTFIAGIIARAAPDAQIMVTRCFAGSGTGTSFNIAKAIYHAAHAGADVINMSFGMIVVDTVIQMATEFAHNQNIVMVASAGNSGLEIYRFPGSLDFVMNVAAVDSGDYKADFSNYHGTVAVSACGVSLYGPLCVRGSYEWGWWSGTSFATAYVSSLAALVKSTYPSYTADQIEEHIRADCDDISALNTLYAGKLGSGRVNFVNSVYIPGDANSSRMTNIGDAIFLVNYLFRSGPAPIPEAAADANCDGVVDLGDAVHIVNYIFRSGTPPGCFEE